MLQAIESGCSAQKKLRISCGACMVLGMTCPQHLRGVPAAGWLAGVVDEGSHHVPPLNLASGGLGQLVGHKDLLGHLGMQGTSASGIGL